MTVLTQLKQGSTRTLLGGCLLAVLLAAVCLMAGCMQKTQAATDSSTQEGSQATAADTSGMDFEYSDTDKDGSWDDASATHVTLSQGFITVDGNGALAQGSTLSVNSAGTYVLSGTLSDGQVVVEAGTEDKVKLVLNGASITCGDGPALYVKQADKVFVTLADASTNSLADGSSYMLEDGSDEPYATLFSKDDLTINGNGALKVTSSYRHAICSKDDLIVTGGSLTIQAAEDALRGRDCVKICGGSFDITAAGDGIKSNNDEDATRGFVSIDGGRFDITAGDDGIQAATLLRVTGGTATIDAADDALHSDLEAQIDEGTLNITAGDDAVHAETILSVNGGTTTVAKCYEGLEAQAIYINGGTNTITASDDGINAAAADLTASEGATSSSSSSAATDAAAQTPQVPAGRGDGESTNEFQRDGGKPGTGMFDDGMASGNASCVLEINGGYTVIDASGDGIDSNGSLSVTGGVTLVSGPTDNGNGALDWDLGASISGGVFIAVGSAGMAQSFDSSSTQAFLATAVSGDAGELLSLTDSSGKVLCSFSPKKSYAMVVASAPTMATGTAYTVNLGGTIANADANGYANSGAVSGATSAGSVEAGTESSGNMGMGAVWGGGGNMGGAANGPQGGMPDGAMPPSGAAPSGATSGQGQGNGGSAASGNTGGREGGFAA